MNGVRALAAATNRVIVVAHREDTARLRAVLVAQGFAVTEARGPYSADQRLFAANIRCLVNHANAWRLAAESDKLTIVVEADFVPVHNFGRLPLPFPPAGNEPRFGWLYSGASVLYGIDEHGFPFGHGSTTVAYVLNAPAAKALLKFFGEEMSRPNPGEYRPWETYMGIFLRRNAGIRNYVPVYQYGEHGGSTNPEHQGSGIRGWHEADVLWSRLAFAPAYCRGRRTIYLLRRLRGWTRGAARLVTLRFFDPRHVNPTSHASRLRMAILAGARLLRLAPLAVGRLSPAEER